MKTNFLPKNRTTRQLSPQTIILSVVIFILVVIYLGKKISLLPVVSPLLNLKNSINQEFSNGRNYFLSKEALIEENNKLKERLSSQNSLVVSYNELGDKYEKLLLEVANKPKEVKVSAGVIGRPPTLPYDVLIIDAGSEKGIIQGEETILPFGGLIGSVTEVSASFSKITLLSTSGLKTEAKLERGDVPVELDGEGGGNFEIRLPRDIEVQKGDKILSLGVNPRLIAVVEDISEGPTDAYKRVLAGLSESPFSISYVYILK